jgi:hypothetical protein
LPTRNGVQAIGPVEPRLQKTLLKLIVTALGKSAIEIGIFLQGAPGGVASHRGWWLKKSIYRYSEHLENWKARNLANLIEGRILSVTTN